MQGLLEMLDQLNASMRESDQAAKKEAESRVDAVLVMRQWEAGPVTAPAFVLRVGPVSRFPKSKQMVSHLVLNPREDSSGGP
jgi:transposase